MDPIRCLVVDDEPLAVELIASYVQKTPFLTLVATANNAQEALLVLEAEDVDLLFLDIQMPGLTGTEFAATLRSGPRVIFSTAYDQFAVEGFRLDALDYLLKPYNYAEFLRAATKARDVLRASWETLAIPAPEEVNAEFFFVKSENRLVRIDVARILFVESMKDYVKIHLQGEARPVLSLMTLKMIQARLPESEFLRVHRSFLVQMRHVCSVEKGEVVIGAARIGIAEKIRSLVEERLLRL